jgi:bifunctional non-homologous end joining protein LigD
MGPKPTLSAVSPPRSSRAHQDRPDDDDTPLPKGLAPMRAVSGELPSERDDVNWAYEIKWDGMRALGFCDRGHLRLQSANGIDATERFPELTALAEALAEHRAVVDGEIVAFGPDGNPSFSALQPRMHTATRVAALEKAQIQPVAYVLFDLLWLDGVDATPVLYVERTRLLHDLVDPTSNWPVPDAQLGGGQALLDAARARGLEGVMAKRRDSPYLPGRRSPTWRKIKIRHEQELVVGGWTPGERGRESSFGALLVGYYEDGHLRYAGRVGSGFNTAELDAWKAELAAAASDRCPFDPPPPAAVRRQAHWVAPRHVVQVAFAEWTGDGVLRQPSYLGRRIDVEPTDVRREPEPAG